MGAAAMPTIASVGTAVAASDWKFPIPAAQTDPWIPLDATAAARLGWEIHMGYYPDQKS
jgi:hypothetical protein